MDKISSEVAEQEFNRFIELMDIDADTSGMSQEDSEEFGTLRKRLVNAIVNGSLVVNDSGEPIFTPQRTKEADPITFFEPTGASLMAMDRKKKNEDVSKMFATMADMTRTHASTYSKMKNADLKICLAVATLFLA